MTSDEASLEAGIRAADDCFRKARSPGTRREAFKLLANLHALRSPAMAVAAAQRRRA